MNRFKDQVSDAGTPTRNIESGGTSYLSFLRNNIRATLLAAPVLLTACAGSDSGCRPVDSPGGNRYIMCTSWMGEYNATGGFALSQEKSAQEIMDAKREAVDQALMDKTTDPAFLASIPTITDEFVERWTQDVKAKGRKEVVLKTGAVATSGPGKDALTIVLPTAMFGASQAYTAYLASEAAKEQGDEFKRGQAARRPDNFQNNNYNDNNNSNINKLTSEQWTEVRTWVKQDVDQKVDVSKWNDNDFYDYYRRRNPRPKC